MKKLRLFYGVPLSDEVKNQIFNFLRNNKLFRKDYKWVERKNYHITLKFLGEVEETYVNELIKIGEEVANKFEQFFVETNDFSGFPDKKRARVFFLDLKERGFLENIFLELEKRLSSLNFEKDKRKYHPHITLARIKGFETLPELKPLNLKIKIEGFTLYESILRKEGPLYKILKFFPLRRT